jgi:RNA-directed DNA polymerase
VDQTSHSQGRNTSGVDGHIFDKEPKAKIKMVQDLRQLADYKCQPVRRVYIPKSKGKLRPLGIPTI